MDGTAQGALLWCKLLCRRGQQLWELCLMRNAAEVSGACRGVTAVRMHQLQRSVGAVCLRCLSCHPNNHAK